MDSPGGIQLNASFLYNFNLLLHEAQSQALIVSSFKDHSKAQEPKCQKLQKATGSIKMNAVTGG